MSKTATCLENLIAEKKTVIDSLPFEAREKLLQLSKALLESERERAVIVEDSFQSLRQIKENRVLLCKILTEGIIQPLVNCIGRQIETMSPLPAVAETMEGMTESLSQLQQDVARLKRAADFTLANMPPSKFQTL